MDINGIVALVTGAGSGLGAATAVRLAEEGARVACIDLDEEAAATTAGNIGGLPFGCDVGDPVQVQRTVDSVCSRVGIPRLVVNCAGIAPAARVIGRDGAVAVDVFARTLQVNLIGTYAVLSHAARHMATLEPLADGERGVIVNTASIAFADGQIGQAAYAAAKGGVASLTLPVARDLARHGIRCMTIAPGLFQTAMMAGLPETVREGLATLPPFPQRLGHAQEFAALVCHIAGNVMLNGEVIRLDGAVRLPPR